MQGRLIPDLIPEPSALSSPHASRASWRFRVILCLLLATGLSSLLRPATGAMAHATVQVTAHPTPVTTPSSTTINRLRQTLKQQIHVTRHHAPPVSTPPASHPSTSSAPRSAQNGSQPAYTNVGTSDDSTPASGNYDGGGNSYSAQALQGAGLLPGQLFTTNGISYVWPAATSGIANNYAAQGQIIPVTPSIADAMELGILGSSSGNDASGTATITYTDQSTQTFTLGFTNWWSATPSFGNTAVASMPYLNTPAGKLTHTVDLFTAEVAITAGKTVQSVTLPPSSSPGTLHVFAVGVSGPAYTNTGTSTDSSPSAGNFDGGGKSYSAQALQSANVTPGEPVISDGISYAFPTSAPGTANNYAASGQVLPVVPMANATTLGLLGAAVGGNSTGSALITYTDGSSQPITLGVSDWTLGGVSQAQPAYGNLIAASMTYRNTATGQQTINTYLFSAEFPLTVGKTVQSVTLPTTSTPGSIHIFAVGTRGVYNNIGTSDDANVLTASLDTGGQSFSAEALQGAFMQPGQPVVGNGIDFTWPAAPVGTPNNYAADGASTTGPTLPMTPQPGATTLGLLGVATNGSSSGTATITYSDGSTQPFSFSLTDWWSSTPATGNTLVTSMPYINAPTGASSHTVYLYEVETSLQAGKTLQSVTLPATSSPGVLHIFAVGTRTAYNNIGISDDASVTGANYDGAGKSYSNTDFTDPNTGMGWNPGDTLTYNGMNFIWPDVPAGQADNYEANGQTIPVSPVANADTIGFIGAATNAPGTGSTGTATITYTDQTTSTISLGMTDWYLNVPTDSVAFGNRLFAVLSHSNTPTGQITKNTYLFYAEFPLSAGKTVQSVKLPSSVSAGQLHIFSIGTRAGAGYANNVGTTDDASPSFGNYDDQNNSYSLQALQTAAHIVPGQPFIFRGVSYTWPSSYSVIPDNYETGKGTIPMIPVTPVPNATTLALIGSASNGSTSGTATITYTDNSTSTFTLGFPDWTVGTPSYGDNLVAAMPYLNGASGTQNRNIYLYEAETSVPAGKTVQRVTLPNISGQIHVFAVGTRSDQYNNAGTSDDSTPYFGNLDGGGNSYSAQGLQSVGLAPGQQTTINGVTFTWPPATSGLYNNYQVNGQVVPVTPVANASTLAFLGAATGGATSGTATITYTDNSTQTFTLGFADWNSSSVSSLPYGNSVVATMPYRNRASGGAQTISTYVFTMSVSLQAGKTVQSVTLPPAPGSGALHVFALGTE